MVSCLDCKRKRAEMRRSWEYPSSQTGDYHDHLSKMIRAPSILPDVPHYPNVHKAFNRAKGAGSEEGNTDAVVEVKQSKTPVKHSKGGKHSLYFKDKVEVIEFKEEPVDKKEKAEVPEASVDSAADDYIQRRRQKFELCKWSTFKVH